MRKQQFFTEKLADFECFQDFESVKRGEIRLYHDKIQETTVWGGDSIWQRIKYYWLMMNRVSEKW